MTGRVPVYTSEDVALLAECGRALCAATSLDEIASLACHLGRSVTAADGVAFVVRDGDETVYLDDEVIGPLWKGRRFAIDDCIAGWAMLHGATVVIPEIEADARIPTGLYRSTFVASLAMAPIYGPRDEANAAIGAYWEKAPGPTPRSVALLEAIAGFAGVAMTNVRRLRAEIDARRQAEEASRAKDEFLAILGHELRNPLAPIVTVLSLIKLRAPDPFERERQIIERQVGHVVRLVDDLLDVARIARGAIQLRRAAVELSWILTRALEVAGPAIAERGHEIVVSVSARGLAIDADVDRFTQVVANLLTNAAKYTPRGGRIEVIGDAEGFSTEDGSRTRDQKSECVRLVVRDTGVGIDPAMLPRIFDLFASSSRDGLGLGLSIVRSIVELHGGVVSAASEGHGRGATFTVRIPRVASVEPDSGQVSEPVLVGTRPLHVLVVDDNVDAAETLGDLLGVMGHDATVVHDAAVALEKLQTFVPDVAFLDIGLPVIDGYELAARMRAMAAVAAVPLVAVTGYGHPADRSRTRAAGFVEHLVKPLSADKLRAVLGKIAV